MSNEILQIIKKDSHKIIYQKYKGQNPFNVVEFGKNLGIQIKESNELPKNISGFIKKLEDESIAICVNSYNSLERKRFTVAHELGHYFLHEDLLKDGIVDSLNRDGAENKIEYEANDFAANLLMPVMDFTKLWHDSSMNIEYMSRYFLVSQNAILTRARFLKLTNEYNYFY